jgi:hypothetical protein
MFTEVGIKMVQDALLHLGEPSSGLGESCVEIVLPRYLDKPIRSSIESHLAEALKSACVGRIAGGSGGNGKTDFFVTLTDLCVGISVVRSVLLAHEITQDAVIKQYEPVAIVHRLN